jgi:hypothetical protein
MTEIRDDMVIGYPQDIIRDLTECIRRGWIDDEEYLSATEELIAMMSEKDPTQAQRCVYHPMGAWYIAPLDTH